MRLTEWGLIGFALFAVALWAATLLYFVFGRSASEPQPDLAGAIAAMETSIRGLEKQNNHLTQMLAEYQAKQPEAKPLIAAELKTKKPVKVKLEDVFPEWQGPSNSPEDIPADLGCLQSSGPQEINLFPVCRILGWKLGDKIVVTGEGAIQREDGFEFGSQPFEQDVSKVFKLPEARAGARWLAGPTLGFGTSGIAYGGQLIGPPRHLWRVEYRPSVTVIKTPDEFMVLATANVGIRR